MAEEVWKPVPAPYDEFEASDSGNLKENGIDLDLKPGSCKYIRVQLNQQKHKQKSIAAHVLVAMAHIPNPDNKPQADHINGNKSDNRVENLRWVTQEENMSYCWENKKKVNNTKSHRRIYECVETGDRFNSYKDAAKFINRHPKRLYDVYVGIQQTAGGYHWKFIEE